MICQKMCPLCEDENLGITLELVEGDDSDIFYHCPNCDWEDFAEDETIEKMETKKNLQFVHRLSFKF